MIGCEERTTEGSPVPPVRVVVSLLEGRVGLKACLACVTLGGVVAFAVTIRYAPLLGLLIAILIETVCSASRGARALVYKYPRFHERIVSLSPVITIASISAYYAVSGHIKISGLVVVVLLLLYASLQCGTEKIVNLLLFVSAALLQGYQVTRSIEFLALSLFPLLLAAGYSIATLIYREAAGIT